jgi:hypothetical protein
MHATHSFVKTYTILGSIYNSIHGSISGSTGSIYNSIHAANNVLTENTPEILQAGPAGLQASPHSSDI